MTYYRSVMVYGNDNKLLYILTPEGTVSRTEGSAGTSYTYNYFKKDQMGSTRAVLSAVGNSLQNVQSTDYYPFGLAYSTNNLNKNKYLFSGKELQDASIGETILGLYDFGARFYDPILGRWFNVDPAAQMANPYLFCGNAPMMYVDPDGNFFGLFSAAIGAIAGALIGGTINVLSHLNEIHNFWGALGYFGVGAVMGVISSYTGFWAADATKALGFIPGMLAGGLMGSTTGLANSFLLTGMNNLISGNSFMDNMGKNVTSGLLNGLITGALSGGIKGFQAAKEKDANPVTGYKVDETSIIDYGRTDLESKGYVPPQQDNSKLCYASALEYADKGHGDRPASFFAQIAENAPGDDPALVANEVKDITPTASYPSQMSITEWKQLGESLNRNVEFIGTYGATSTSHAVNIIGLRLGKVYRIFGGGVGRKLKPLQSIIWNPIGGKIQTIKPNFNKIIRIKY